MSDKSIQELKIKQLESYIAIISSKNINASSIFKMWDERSKAKDWQRKSELDSLISAYICGDIELYEALRAYQELLIVKSQMELDLVEESICVK